MSRTNRPRVLKMDGAVRYGTVQAGWDPVRNRVFSVVCFLSLITCVMTATTSPDEESVGEVKQCKFQGKESGITLST